jgi:hypothetical protein
MKSVYPGLLEVNVTIIDIISFIVIIDIIDIIGCYNFACLCMSAASHGAYLGGWRLAAWGVSCS